MKKLIGLLFFATVMSACGAKTVKVLDASWTSMKHPMPPAPESAIDSREQSPNGILR